jgi:hypothetical protein
MVQDKGGQASLCHYLRGPTQAPGCQRVPADPVDQQVVTAFFAALAPAELARYDHALAQRRQQQEEIERAHHQALPRLAYEADRARDRYAPVDPASRLGAAALEQRWAAA